MMAVPVSAVAEPSVEPPVRIYSETVSGWALNEQGHPIEGATIYLVKTNCSPENVLAQVTNNANGRYEFRDAPLESNDIGPWHEMAYFRVVDKAAGKSFAWRGMKNMYTLLVPLSRWVAGVRTSS